MGETNRDWRGGRHERGGRDDDDGAAPAHLQCPFCTAYAVARLYLASLNIDSCECACCGARWDEECGTGAYKGRASPSLILIERQ